MHRLGTSAAVLILSFIALSQSANAIDAGPRAYDGLIARHAAANGLPESLVRRVIVRESRYNPRAVVSALPVRWAIAATPAACSMPTPI